MEPSRISLRWLRRLIWNDTLRKCQNVPFSVLQAIFVTFWQKEVTYISMKHHTKQDHFVKQLTETCCRTALWHTANLKIRKKFRPMSACADCACWHGSILFANTLNPLFSEDCSYILYPLLNGKYKPLRFWSYKLEKSVHHWINFYNPSDAHWNFVADANIQWSGYKLHVIKRLHLLWNFLECLKALTII